MSIEQTSDGTFEKDVLQSNIPVLVDFWAEWCGPCLMIAPTLEEIAAEMKGRLKIVKLNIQDNPQTPAQYGVKSIPTLAIFHNGQAISTEVGALAKGKLSQWIQNVLQHRN